MSRLVLVLAMALVACKTDNKPTETKPAPEAPRPVAPPKPVVPAPAPPATEPDKADSAALEAKGFVILEQMGDLFIADAKDCEKLAVDLKAFITTNKPAMLQLSEMERRQTPEEQKAYNARTKTKQDAMMQRIEPAVDACKANPNVQAAMAEIPD